MFAHYWQSLTPFWQWAVIVTATLLALGLFVWVSGMVRYIPNNRLGDLEKLWSPTGSVEAASSR